MNAQPTFWSLAGLALLLSAAAAIAHWVLQPWLGALASVQLLLVVLSLVWLLAALRHMPPGGRALVAVAWLIGAAALCWWQPALWMWLLVLGVPLWLRQAFTGSTSTLVLAAHAGLQLAALLAALAALRQTHSVFWMCWCWLLVQALAVLLPGTGNRLRDANDSSSDHGFDRARHVAEAALRRLAIRS